MVAHTRTATTRVESEAAHGAGTSEPSWLAELLDPLPVSEFLCRHWLQRHLLCRGAPERFSGLLSWPILNQILEHHWRETYRFRLARHGRDLDPASYTDQGGYTPRIRARAITEQLRCGATLSFDAIDEVHGPLTRLAESFEAFFRGATKINIYAGWRTCHGLDLHRDNQEIFIAQLDGRKRWLLYGFSVDGRDRSQLRDHSVPPPGAERDEILTAGDFLYIPRGCYHVALPLNEPTLHLTIGVKNPREDDLLQWLVDRVRATGAAERDLPCLADQAERVAWSDRLRSALRHGLDEDLVAQYLAETGSNFKPRPVFNLPWSATAEGLPPGQDFLVRLNAARAPLLVQADPGGSAVVVRHGGHAYRFPRSVTAILDQLGGTPQPIGRVIDAVAGRLDETVVRLLMAMLVKHDIVAVPAPDTDGRR
jgi:ribosomal protein L16 Arg81 hydroxylase